LEGRKGKGSDRRIGIWIGGEEGKGIREKDGNMDWRGGGERDQREGREYGLERWRGKGSERMTGIWIGGEV
jgi:hypothetical protein